VASGCLAGCPYRVSCYRRRSSQLKLVWSLSCSWRDLQGVWLAQRPQAGDASAKYGLVAGRLAFPASSLALPVTRMAFEVFPARAAVHIREEWSCNTFVALALLQSASVCAGSEDPPLMRFIQKCAPLPFVRCASSPGKQASHRLELAKALAWAVHVVSHHLDGLLRAKACGFVASRYRFWSSLRFNVG
jgi:hypothetical protein